MTNLEKEAFKNDYLKFIKNKSADELKEVKFWNEMVDCWKEENYIIDTVLTDRIEELENKNG